ncbi:MAG: hypothetical protein NTV01_13815 [Bacteroidia bacterium]|nr:hypothetical protein [Bacteroidia bacterium]
MVYNPDDQKKSEKIISFDSPDYFGAIDLDPDKNYYAYEFWDNRLAGEIKGSDSLRLDLRPGEAKMISIREKQEFPQLLSTDRHIMQGLVETRDLRWDPVTLQLTGKVNLVQGEEMNLTFANNGYLIKNASVEGGTAAFSSVNQDQLSKVKVTADQPGWRTIILKFQKE